MKTAIIYMSKHGTTEKVAKKIANQLNNGEVDLINLKENKFPKIESFERIMIGGSIHAGMLQKRVKSFCEKNMISLLEKEVGLFLCCMEKDEKAKEQFENSFYDDIKSHAKATAVLGGEFIFEKMNFLEKAIVKKVSGIKETTSDIDERAIAEFVNKMN